MGIPPESVAMRVGFVVLGAGWLLLAVGVASRSSWAWPAGVALAVGTLWYLVPGTWYLVPGTVISVVVLALLLTPPVRRALGRS